MLDDLWRLFGIGIEKFLDKDPEKFCDRLMSSYLSMTLLSVDATPTRGRLNSDRVDSTPSSRFNFDKTRFSPDRQNAELLWVPARFSLCLVSKKIERNEQHGIIANPLAPPFYEGDFFRHCRMSRQIKLPYE